MNQPLSETSKKSIITEIKDLAPGGIIWLNKYLQDEVEYIIWAVRNQSRKHFEIELNNNFTKIRKCNIIN